MTVTSLVQGSVFAGRYRVVRCIAHGGMGAVYEVVHLETDRRRALKVMLPSMIQSKEMHDRFRLEARVTANIESEFIVDVADAGIDADTQMPFMVMEYLRGEELSKRLKRLGRFEFHEVVTYLHQAAMALDKTHQASIVHRDLKPGNLFLTERDDGSPRIKVLDFGIAKLVADNTTNGGMTQSLGTPLYMAPEQFKSGHRVSPASDIYSLAMLAYHLLVGKAYWAAEEGDNVYTIIASAVNGPKESARARAHRQTGVLLPPAFDAWFFRAASVKPSDRFPTAGETVLALAGALGIEAPNRRRTTFPEEPRSRQPSFAEIAPSEQRPRQPSIPEIAPPMMAPPPQFAPATPPGLHNTPPGLYNTPPGLHNTPPGMPPPGAAPPAYAAPRPADPRPSFPSIPNADVYQAMPMAPAPGDRISVHPRVAPDMPRGASPPIATPITPIQPTGASTAAGFSHTSAGFASPNQAKKNIVPILVAAGIAFALIAGMLTVILASGGSTASSDAANTAASPEKPNEASTSPTSPAPPAVTPAPTAEAAAPVEIAEPTAPDPSAAAAATSKPKAADSSGKASRPPTKPKPNVVYTPD